MMRDAAFKEVIKIRPKLVRFWAACCGGIEAPWVIFDDGSRIEVTFLFQEFGLSPEFVALGVRGLLRPLRSVLVSLPSAQGKAPALSAYLDDICRIATLEAIFDSFIKLRELGPENGLHFDGFLKKDFYVPLRFKNMFLSFLPRGRPIESLKMSRMKRRLPSRRTLKRLRRRSGSGPQLRMGQWLG